MSTIVTRAGKGSPLTHNEVDQNFTNLNTDKLEVGAAFNAAVAATPAVTANTAKVTNATHTGDVTGATALTLATVNANVGAFGSATQVATFTVNAKGLTTAAGSTSIAIPASAVTDFSEAVDDRVAALVVAGTNMTVTYNDGAGTLTFDAAGGGAGTNLSYTAATRIIASDTGTDATLPLVTSGDAGLAPASGGGTTNFLRADGTWAAPSGGGGGAPQIMSWMI